MGFLNCNFAKPFWFNFRKLEWGFVELALLQWFLIQNVWDSMDFGTWRNMFLAVIFIVINLKYKNNVIVWCICITHYTRMFCNTRMIHNTFKTNNICMPHYTGMTYNTYMTNNTSMIVDEEYKNFQIFLIYFCIN